ncbi:hypothetical protein [Lysobacter fragariae]
MASVFATFQQTCAALRGRLPVAGAGLIQHVNNNRNNASLPRAGD